jgi:hypothetical protein
MEPEDDDFIDELSEIEQAIRTNVSKAFQEDLGIFFGRTVSDPLRGDE